MDATPASPRSLDADATRRFGGLRDLQAALRTALLQAAANGEPRIDLVDDDFSAWPLDDADVLDALTAWARGPHRHLVLLARGFDDVVRRHPRFTAWRRHFAHVIECRAAPDVDRSEFPLLLLTSREGVHAGSGPRFAGRWLDEEADRRTWRGVVEAITQRSEAAFPAHPLGL